MAHQQAKIAMMVWSGWMPADHRMYTEILGLERAMEVAEEYRKRSPRTVLVFEKAKGAAA
jgi:hypothetical protein